VGIDFQVAQGEVFGLLGPNGAGKTSTIEILEGLRPRTGGDAMVLGFDPDRQKQQLKDRIGVCLQATNLPAKMRVQEALELFGSFYTRSLGSEQLLKRLQLWEKRAAFYETLSGGQKQRLALACAVLHRPRVLFLDEPTGGVDPISRRRFWGLIDRMSADGVTIIVLANLAQADPVGLAHGIAEVVRPELVEKPIKDTEPETTAFHRKLLESMLAGSAFDKDAFSAEAQQSLFPRLATLGQRFKTFGPLESFEPLQRNAESLNVVHRYLVKFPAQPIVFSVVVDEHKKISGLRVLLK